MKFLTLLLIMFLPVFAYAISFEELTTPPVLTAIVVLLLALSELLGVMDVVKPNGIIQGIVALLKKLVGR